MVKKKLLAILKSHEAWLRGEADGIRANLFGANLTDANLYGANMSMVDITIGSGRIVTIK